MPLTDTTTLTAFLIEAAPPHPEAQRRPQRADHSTSRSPARRSRARSRTARSPACSATPTPATCRAKRQKKLDVVANDIFLRINEWGGHVAGMVSEEMDEPYQLPAQLPARQVPAAVRSARRLVEHRRQRRRSAASSRSCARRTPGADPQPRRLPAARHRARSCAGYAIYGPSTMLVLTRRQRRARASRSIRMLGEFMLTPSATCAMPAETQRVRDQRLQQPLLGAAGQALRRRMPGRPDRRRAARTSTCAGSPRWWPRRIAS